MVASINHVMQETMAIPWGHLVQATNNDKVLSTIIKAIEEGTDFKDISTSQFARYQDALYNNNGVLMYRDRVVVPSELRPIVLQHLHSAHQGVSGMEKRAQSIVFWPGITRDIQKTRSECYECNKNAPSNAPIPALIEDPPSTPFEKVFSDFFNFGGNHYLVVGDRLSGWTEIFSTSVGGSNSGARGLIKCLRRLFSTFGVPYEISSDGGPEFVSDETTKFLRRWNVSHRISSAYYPRSNGRAEVAVKSAKRLLRANVGPSGSLDNDGLLRALLQLRNTPDSDCDVSPAEILFGRPLRDSFAFTNRLEKFKNPAIRKTWRDAWETKERALRVRFTKATERLNEHVRVLPPLKVGDRCLVQNQNGNNPKKWDRSGVITEVLPFHQYNVIIDGSRRVTRRNRRFLRSYMPATTIIMSGLPQTPAYAHDTLGNGTSLTPVEQRNMPSSHRQQEVTDLPVPESTAEPECPNHGNQEENAPAVQRASSKPPLARTRLLGYNNPGLKEQSVTPGSRRCRQTDFHYGQ